MSRYMDYILWLKEGDLEYEAREKPLEEHLKTEYQRGINKYFQQFKPKRK